MPSAMKVIKMTQDGLLQNLSGYGPGAIAPAAPTFDRASNVISIERAWRERGLDDTLAETFPCSDPLSSIPDPKDFESSKGSPKVR
jgi:hypothetical protein